MMSKSNPYLIKAWISIGAAVLFGATWFVRVPTEALDSLAGLVTGILFISGMAWLDVANLYQNGRIK